MATYAPVSSVVVSGGDVSPRRIVERDLSPNRTITRVISPTRDVSPNRTITRVIPPTYAPTSSVVAGGPREPLLVPPVVKQTEGACLTAQQTRWLLWIIVGLLAAMVALAALLWPSQLVMEKIVSVEKCPFYEQNCPNVNIQQGAEVGQYCSTPCQWWHGDVDMRWCPSDADHSGDVGTSWGWCSEKQDGKKLCPLQTALAFFQEKPAWTDIECSSDQVCLEANAEDPKRACATERVVSVDMCPSYEPHCGNALQPGGTVGDYCSIACQHWHGNKEMRWCPTGADHSGLANAKWGWCKEAEA